ncbi:MAG: symmetrical bis(5'-nucleosyl)-tetraphosphatase [Gammaproteobacteria bacterium]|nr:symmetrical bis(5'-nucleosyl)-tetraphosphatase [Gammaproteobacteria bacterium]
MAVYAIGDVQGCLSALQALLARIGFDARTDQLWFVGDLVNRGPQSLETVRLVMGLGERAVTVLGNHDLHLLAVAQGLRAQGPRDCFDELLQAPDREQLFDWIRSRPLLHHDARLGYTMIHAGLPPQWDLADAQTCAREVEAVLRGDDYRRFIAQMYGDEPARWAIDVHGVERWRFIVNCFTRLRYCDQQGRLVLKEKGAPGTQAPGVQPWFAHPARRSRGQRILFGHWSTLGYHAQDGVYALDTGCVWGGELTALRIDSAEPQRFAVPCQACCATGEMD